MKSRKKEKMVGYVLYRKCDTYKEWSVDLIFPQEKGWKDAYARAKYFREKNASTGKLINLKQKIKKAKITIEPLVDCWEGRR